MDSPSTSSFLTPLARRHRRSSVGSVISQMDKETLSQALDSIHNAASQSDSLTTFNEFSAEPVPSASDTGRMSGDLQGGLSGLYSRLRSSVSAREPRAGAIDAAETDTPTKTRSATSPKPTASRRINSLRAASPSASGPRKSRDADSRSSSLSLKRVPSEHSKQANGRTEVYKTEKSEIERPVLSQRNSSSYSSQIESAGATNGLREETPQSSRTSSRRDLTEDLQSPNLTKQIVTSPDSFPGEPPTSIESAVIAPDQNPFASLSKNSHPAADDDEDEDPFGDSEATALELQTSGETSQKLNAETDDKSLRVPVIHYNSKAAPDNVSTFPPPSFELSRPSSPETGRESSRSRSGSFRGSTIEVASSQPMTRLSSRASQLAATNRDQGAARGVGAVLNQIKNRVLSKEYWMRDENAKDCAYCGDPFSTFRRKHHCRTCGQIFDAKCTSLVSGVPFGQSGTLRVCKPCEGMINGYDDSSELSDEGSVMGGGSSLRPRNGSTGTGGDISPARSLSSMRNSFIGDKSKANTVPTMAIPATRRLKDESKSRPAVLEIDAEPKIPRPGSSRSLKTGGGLRSAHKRHHSRHLLQRSKSTSHDVAPFHRHLSEDPQNGNRLSAFHSDNVIDPELADYLSNDDSSGDEQASIISSMNGGPAAGSKGQEPERGLLSGLFSGRRHRSKTAEKALYFGSNAGRDTDSVSLSSARTNPRFSRRRNLSTSSNLLLRPSPRMHRHSSTNSPAFIGSHLHDSLSVSAIDEPDTPNGLQQHPLTSASLKGAETPAIELNSASMQHVRRLLHQLLTDSDIPNVPGWEKALMPILLRATDDVNPDVQGGDDMDIRHYVKLKKIPGGKMGDTTYVSGLVFTKNLALKSMPRSISQPNILILTFPLEFSRHRQNFLSLELLIRQEKEFLQNLVHRIAALKPNLLLVERGVSGLALKYLEEAHIATAFNVKRSVLEAVSRCSQTRIITSIDKLAIKPAQAGSCSSFYLKTYVHQGKRKTCMYVSGCPKELGCTIVLRGAEMTVLARIKRITEFMIYVVYNLKLETYFMRDEFALLPAYNASGTIASDADTKKLVDQNKGGPKPEHTSAAASISEPFQEARAHLQSAAKAGTSEATDNTDMTADDMSLPEDVPMPTFYGDLIEAHRDKILSVSPYVRFMQPYLLTKAREQERRLVYLRGLLDQEESQDQESEKDDLQPENFVLITPDMIHESLKGTSKKVREVLRAVQDAEYDKAVHNYNTQKKQWESNIAGNSGMFDPFDHQNIAVLYSLVCTSTSIPCSGPDILALGFYNEHESGDEFDADCTVGQYVEELCLGAYGVCVANNCERKMIEHHRQYVHGGAQLSVTVENSPSKVRGLQDIILMWAVCRKCNKETQVTPMSDNTWKYSFGKYLELAYWSKNLHPRAGLCSHDLHRDYLRFFGFKNIAVRFQYDTITLLDIIVPRTRITWKVENDLKFKNEVFSRYEERVNRFMTSVKDRLQSIRIDSVLPEKVVACKEEVDRLSKKAAAEHVYLSEKLRAKYMGSKYYEVIPLNRAIRATQEKVAEWDTAFAEFDANFFPSEKDIRRLASLQLRKIFLDNNDSATSLTSLTSNEDGMSNSISEADSPEKEMSEKQSGDLMIFPDRAREMLASVMGGGTTSTTISSPVDTLNTTSSPDGTSAEAPSTEASLASLESQNVRHLDLALSSAQKDSPEIATSEEASPTAMVAQRSPTNSSTENISPHPKTTIKEGERKANMSGIPRPMARTNSNPQARTQSQPAHPRREKPRLESGTAAAAIAGAGMQLATGAHDPISENTPKADKKLADRFSLNAIKSGISNHSMIPRSVGSKRKHSRVSALAKHFDQLSREFEKERLRDRRQQAANNRRSRAYPMAHSKPIIEVYKDAHEAVTEKDPSEEEDKEEKKLDDLSSAETGAAARDTSQPETRKTSISESFTTGEKFDTATENTENEEAPTDSRAESEGEGTKSDDEPSISDMPSLPEDQSIISSTDSQADLKIDLPKHEKTSLMKWLNHFWAERSASGWKALEYPLRVFDHIFADSDIVIREDEPSSLIAFALESEDYKLKLQSIQDKSAARYQTHDKPYVDDLFLSTEEQMRIEHSLLQSTGTHLKYQFQEGSARMLCKIFYAEQFDAVRRKCGVADRIVESLSRCLKWDSKGGKTKSVFLKTLDDRLVLKSLSQVESQSFLKFAPAYFQLMGEALFHELPSVIAKMLGFYQIIIKNPVTGIDFNGFFLVMENLFYDRAPTRIFDLKGSMRNRRIQSTGQQNEVLLDENMVEFIYESPLFAREHSKRLLRASVWNDTLFLSRLNVMDYSLMIAVDESRKELVVGIIDCIRTYTWDKKLESWMKDRGKNRPTVTSPREYKNRFREAMGRYVLQAPNCWHQFNIQITSKAALHTFETMQSKEEEKPDAQVPHPQV